ncbi:hypothetical protein CONLIGDRAFT_680262 [Coniochaeta ligniaria NRRL 30616]|uniref:Uncharacterized protein n=1 Tax=Coniochaeta ligniaria NRRL 30616 TaxID=1408157 RepID=A0A1J7IPX4_9PEZI|nr:hypothetical protein CONLIGDRAFT_680262 [Coniochaeta ligniaria NRRL 30616]
MDAGLSLFSRWAIEDADFEYGSDSRVPPPAETSILLRRVLSSNLTMSTQWVCSGIRRFLDQGGVVIVEIKPKVTTWIDILRRNSSVSEIAGRWVKGRRFFYGVLCRQTASHVSQRPPTGPDRVRVCIRLKQTTKLRDVQDRSDHQVERSCPISAPLGGPSRYRQPSSSTPLLTNTEGN